MKVIDNDTNPPRPARELNSGDVFELDTRIYMVTGPTNTSGEVSVVNLCGTGAGNLNKLFGTTLVNHKKDAVLYLHGVKS